MGRRTGDISALSVPPLLTLTLDRTEITADSLTVSGWVNGGTATATVAGQAFAVNPDGTFSGSVPIALGSNNIVVTVTDANGLTVSDQRSILRSLPATNLDIVSIEAVASNGDIYVTESMPDGGIQGALLIAGTNALTYPAWLAQATDISVDGAGRAYTLQGGRVSVYNGTTDNLLADVSALAVTDVEAAPDGTVYLANNTGALYRLQGGQAAAFATLPASGNTRLEASSFGLVARVGNNFYRVNPDGSAVLLFSAGFGPDFSLDDAGTICYQDEAIVCRTLAGIGTWLPFSAASLESSPGGVLHHVLPDNVYRWDGSQSTALLTGSAAPVGATLGIAARVTADGATLQYTYDAKDQLSTATGGPGGSETYGYDPAGNRTQDHRAADYVYNNLNQLVSGSGYTYVYDIRGNRITKTGAEGTTRYQYDAENRLTRIDFPPGGYAEYAYDPFGRRIQKRVVSAQNQETIRRYVYDQEDILFELDQNNRVLTKFLHGPGIDEPLSLTRNNQTYRYHADTLGSIIAITDPNHTVVQRYTYDAYGNLTNTLNPDFQQPYAYTGREYDAESGLYYYRARYYDPKVGRFISSDPIGLAGGLNTYAYVDNNPLNWIDPEGLAGSRSGGRSSGSGKQRPQPQISPNPKSKDLADALADLLDPPEMPHNCVLSPEYECPPRDPSDDGMMCRANNQEARSEGSRMGRLTCSNPKLVFRCR